ncbi:hypothetical protein M1D80_11850 [Phyllobacteriaceae bacterium JZ32]
MSSRSKVRAVSPAPFAALLEAGGARSYLRRALIAQRLKTESIAFYGSDDELLAIGMLYAWRRRRVELALSIRRAALPHMRQLIRTAHLTLSQMADAGILVFCRVNPMNRAGQRMAVLVGFRPGRLKDPAIWVWRG